jgi:hypothetical protein
MLIDPPLPNDFVHYFKHGSRDSALAEVFSVRNRVVQGSLFRPLSVPFFVFSWLPFPFFSSPDPIITSTLCTCSFHQLEPGFWKDLWVRVVRSDTESGQNFRKVLTQKTSKVLVLERKRFWPPQKPWENKISSDKTHFYTRIQYPTY